MQGKEVLT